MKGLLTQSLIKIIFLAIIFSSCKKDDDSTSGMVCEKQFRVTAFRAIYCGENLHLIIRKGDQLKIIARGNAADITRIACIVTNQLLDIRLTGSISSTLQIELILPVIVDLRVAADCKTDVYGFQRQSVSLNTVISGRANLTLNGTPAALDIEIGGFATATITGATNSLRANLFADSRLFGYNLVSKEVYVSVSNKAIAYVMVENSIDGFVRNDARLYYKGDPVTKNFQNSGNGLVIHE